MVIKRKKNKIVSKIILINIILLLIIVSGFSFQGSYHNFNLNKNFFIINYSNSKLVKNATGVIGNLYYYNNNEPVFIASDNKLNYSPIIYPNDYYIFFNVIDKVNYSHTTTYNFSIVSEDPQIYPKFFYISKDGNFNINGNYTNLKSMKFIIYDNSGTKIIDKTLTFTQSSGAFSFNVHLTNPGVYKSSFYGKSENGRVVKIDRLLYYDNEPPQIISSIKNGDVLINYIYEKVYIKDNLGQLTPVYYNYKLYNNLGNLVASGRNSVNNPLILNPSGGTYKLIISTSDLAGNEVSKEIDFTLVKEDNAYVQLYLDNNLIKKKDLYLNQKQINGYINIPKSEILNFVKLNSKELLINVKNNLYYFDLNLTSGVNKLEISVIKDGQNINQFYNLNYINSTQDSTLLTLNNLSKINQKVIERNNYYLSNQRVIFISGNAKGDLYLNNKYLGYSKFGTFYVLHNGNNTLTFDIRKGNILLYRKNVTVKYVPLLNALASPLHIPKVIGSNSLHLDFNTTNSYSLIYIYLNGKLQKVILPNNNRVDTTLTGFRRGINYISIWNEYDELYVTPVIFDPVENSNFNIKRIYSSVSPYEGVPFYYNLSGGINTNTLNITICGKSFGSEVFDVTQKYIILKGNPSLYVNCKGNTVDYDLRFKTMTGVGKEFKGSYNLIKTIILKNIYTNSKNSFNITKGLLYLNDNHLTLEFNKEDISVASITIDGAQILDYNYSNLEPNKIFISINKNYIKPEGYIKITLKNLEGNSVSYYFKYYSYKYKPKISMFYVQNYILNSESTKTATVVLKVDNDLGSSYNFHITDISNDYVNLLGKYVIVYLNNFFENFDVSSCILNNCYTLRKSNFLGEDFTNLSFYTPQYVTKNFTNLVLTGSESNIGNLIFVNSVNDITVPIITTSSFKFVNPWTLFGNNFYNFKLTEYSGLKSNLDEFIYYDYEYPKYYFTYNSTSKNFKLYVVEDNLKSVSLKKGSKNIPLSYLYSNDLKDFVAKLSPGKYNLTIVDKVNNTIKDTINLIPLGEDSRSDIIGYSYSKGSEIVPSQSLGSNNNNNNKEQDIVSNLELSCQNNNRLVTFISLNKVSSISSGCSILESNKIPGSLDIYYYKLKCDNGVKTLNINFVNKKTYSYTFSNNCELKENLLNLNITNLLDVLKINGIFFTDKGYFGINGTVNKDASLSIIINNEEIPLKKVSKGNFVVNNIDISSFINQKNDEKLNVQVKAKDNSGRTEESSIFTIIWKKILSAIVKVVVS